jgi:hypothetical protein
MEPSFSAPCAAIRASVLHHSLFLATTQLRNSLTTGQLFCRFLEHLSTCSVSDFRRVHRLILTGCTYLSNLIEERSRSRMPATAKLPMLHRLSLSSDGKEWAYFEYSSLAATPKSRPVFRPGDAIEGKFVFDPAGIKRNTSLKSARIQARYASYGYQHLIHNALGSRSLSL